MKPIQSVAILGPGLIGGSLALALRARYPQVEVRVWARREEAAFEAGKRLTCFASSKIEPIVSGAEVVVFCMPVNAVEAVALACKAFVGEGTLITDACSVKQPVVEWLGPIFGGRFVGAHPMAGGEQAGLAAARVNLFDGAICLLTPTQQTEIEFISYAEHFWGLVGCKTKQLSPKDHDLAVGYVSHLPHVAAAMIVEVLRRQEPKWQELSGPGYCDTTRVAAGGAELWHGILLANRTAVLEALKKFNQIGNEVIHLIEENDEAGLLRFLENARALRTTDM